MKTTKKKLVSLALVCIVLLFGATPVLAAEQPQAQATVVSVSTNFPKSITVGTTTRLIAKAKYSDGTTKELPLVWHSSNSRLLAVNATTGQIRAKAPGEVYLTGDPVGGGGPFGTNFRLKVVAKDSRVTVRANGTVYGTYAVKKGTSVNIKALAKKLPAIPGNANIKVAIKGGNLSRVRYAAFDAATGKTMYSNSKGYVRPVGASDMVVRMTYKWPNGSVYYYFFRQRDLHYEPPIRPN